MKDIILQGNCVETLKTIPDESVDCCITSPPYYGLRDYGVAGQIGLEETPEAYIDRLVSVFREVKRILKPEGTLWVNIGDSYNNAKVGNTEVNKHKCVVADSFREKMWSGAKQKDLIGIPWLLAFALRNDGWYLRQDIIWHKPNPMPESVKDRCTKSHEYIFLLSKSPKYYFDYEAIRERGVMTQGDSAGSYQRDTRATHGLGGGNSGINLAKEKLAKELAEKGYSTRNKRDVWSVTPSHYKEAHFATFPEELVTPMVLAGCPKDGIVLDPFMGSGTTGAVAVLNKRHYIGCELNPEYIELSNRRIADATKIANQVTISDLFENQVTISDLFTERTETE